MQNSHVSSGKLVTNKMKININMFGVLMLNRIQRHKIALSLLQ